MMATSAVSWLFTECNELRHLIRIAAVFGSIAREADKPHDCDFVLVASVNVGTPEWEALQANNQTMREGFFTTFGIPLSVTLLNTWEWDEHKNFFSERITVLGDNEG